MKTDSRKTPEGKTGKKKLPKNILLTLSAEEAEIIADALGRMFPKASADDRRVINEVSKKIINASR